VLVKIYRCYRYAKSGSFLRPKKANRGVNFLSAIRSRYAVEDETEDSIVSLENADCRIVGVKKLHDRRRLSANLQLF
jgi:hypothetical protein